MAKKLTFALIAFIHSIISMTYRNKENRLFLILGCFFIANAVIAEFIGVKIFSVEGTLGLPMLNLSVLGFGNLSFHMSAGVLLWPVVFIMTDIINEYYGQKGVRMLSYIGVALISYAFLMVYLAIKLTPSNFWMIKNTSSGDVNMNLAFNNIFGQGLWIIVGSITAFLVSQIIDVTIFHRIKKATGEKALWFRATGSTIISQFIDSYVVIFIAFYIGGNWSFKQTVAVGFVGYLYKFVIAILLTPILYVIHAAIDAYLGKELAHKMTEEAAKK